MKPLLALAAVFALGSIIPQACLAQIEGGEKIKAPPRPVAEPAKPVPCAERTVRQEQWQLIEEQQATILERLELKEVDAGRRKIIDLEIDFVESRQTGTEIVIKSREVEQEVTTYKTEAVQSTDCNGCPCTIYKRVPTTHKVRVTVYEPVCEKREFIVRSPVARPVEKEVQVKTLVLERTEEPAIRKTFKAVHAQSEFQVPIYSAPPYSPLPPPPCHAPVSVPCCDK